ncbi:MAG TPA: hypothetical protein VLV31_12090 [Candidatus Acidoferrales bacterium]|nr:hypothetical protein [Candidatus Acidoferrales bacterium]
MSETFAERSAGIWFPLVFYAVGGVYLLAFWALYGLMAYHLLALGVASILIAVALYALSKWAYWLGLFTFPLLLLELVVSLNFSVSFVGWYPNIPTAIFNASMIAYLAFLCISFLFLVDKRNTLKTDRVMDRLRPSAPAPDKSGESKSKIV